MRVCIPSVGYGDHLARNLPAWKALLPPGTITVVTDEADLETVDVAHANGVRLLRSDAWRRHDPSYVWPGHWFAYWRHRGRTSFEPVLNKALALDEAFGFISGRTPAPEVGEVCVSIDADCYPVGTFEPERLEPCVLYGCRRYEHLEHDESDGTVARGPEIVLQGLIRTSHHRDVPAVAGGYFQAFRYEPGKRFGSYPGADAYDYDFALTWPRGAVLEDLYVLHRGETHVNWWGRVTPRLTEGVA